MQTATDTAQAVLQTAQAQPVFIAEDPNADFVFGEAGGPRMGGLVPLSHPLSQSPSLSHSLFLFQSEIDRAT